METTFPPALVDKINSMGEPDIQAELATVGEVRMAEPSPLPRHRRSHLARHSLLSRLSEERGPLGHDRHQQSLLVERRRQVLQLRAGPQAGRCHSADRAAAAQRASAGHDRPLHAQPAIPHAVGQHLQLRRLSGVPETLRRRRLEGRVQGQLAGRVLPRLRPEPRSLHDPAARRQVQGIFPLLRGRPGESAHHALRSLGAAPRALREESAAHRSQAAWSAWSAIASRSAARWATT